jgi:hypothetical protein
MSPKATEGVGSTGRDLLRRMKVSELREATPSGLPAISPSRREISSLADFANRQRCKNRGLAIASPPIAIPDLKDNSPANYRSCFSRLHSSSSCSSDR